MVFSCAPPPLLLERCTWVVCGWLWISCCFHVLWWKSWTLSLLLLLLLLLLFLVVILRLTSVAWQYLEMSASRYYLKWSISTSQLCIGITWNYQFFGQQVGLPDIQDHSALFETVVNPFYLPLWRCVVTLNPGAGALLWWSHLGMFETCQRRFPEASAWRDARFARTFSPLAQFRNVWWSSDAPGIKH